MVSFRSSRGRLLAAISSFLLFGRQSHAFSVLPHKPESPPAILSRQSFLSQLATSATASLLLTQPVNAVDVEPAVALRSVEKSLTKLQSMEGMIASSDYLTMREALRVPPVSEIRKSCTSLINSQSGGDASLEKQYRTFISALEQMDAAANLGRQGQTLKEGQLEEAHAKTVSALKDFLALAQKDISVPSSD